MGNGLMGYQCPNVNLSGGNSQVDFSQITIDDDGENYQMEALYATAASRRGNLNVQEYLA